MACVTLKRPLSLDHPYDSLHGHTSPAQRPPAPKRRRCTPLSHNSHREHHERELDDPSPSTSAGVGEASASASAVSPSAPSMFRERPLTPQEIANNLRDELKRLRKRRQLVPYRKNNRASGNGPNGPNGSESPRSSPPSSPEPMMDDASAMRAAAQALSSSHGAPASPNAKSDTGKPIFTLKQMTLICERMCKDRTDQVREEYDKILQQKLAEQYDAFVKFIDHQIQRRFNEAQLPSYLS